MEKKTRRQYSGAVKDKERTKQKLLNAVGEVFRAHGFNGLTIKGVAEKAGVHRRLISEYFGSFGQLIESYIRGKDYWYAYSARVEAIVEKNKGSYARELAQSILLNQLEFFYHNEELQQIIRWQFSDNSPVIHDLCVERERIGSEFFKLTDPFFDGTAVDLRAVTALLVGGIYSLVLHSRTSDTTFCEIDINTPEGMQRIKTALSRIVEGTYMAAERQKKK